MIIQLHDIAGTAGVALIIYCYLALQVGWIASHAPRFSALNALGSGLILLSLTQEFNLAAFVVEVFWLAISLYALVRPRRPPEAAAD